MAEITKSEFGRLQNGSMVYLYRLKNSSGASAGIITYGARLQSFLVPDKNGKMQDIVRGFDDAAGYEAEAFYMGAIVGRHANRIQHARVTINGMDYQLEANDGPRQTNSLHSGSRGFHCQLWGAKEQEGKLVLSYFSPDGDGGFPGNFKVRVTYELTEDNALRISYEASSDADTICNLTNHSYFNLNGYQDDSILGHQLQIFSERLTEADAESLPNGKIYQAAGTPMDFRQLTAIGERIDDGFQQLQWGAGYDHNWILSDKKESSLHKAAYAEGDKSGISLTVYTDMPGLQFYSGNFLDGTPGKGGISYGRRSSFALETQYYPNSPAHPEFPQPILKQGEAWKSVTVFATGTVK